MEPPGGSRIDRVCAVALAVVFAGGAAASGQMMTVRERSYWDTVRQYAGPDRTLAVEAVGRLTDKDLSFLVGSVERLAREARRCEACEARDRFLALPLPLAVLLHGERDRVDRIERTVDEDGAPECTIGLHGLVVERLLKALDLRPGGIDFLARFSVALSAHFRGKNCLPHAKHWAEVGRHFAPNDASVLQAQGEASEALAAAAEDLQGAVPITLFDSAGRPSFATEFISSRQQLNRAREAYAEALVLNPDLAEARLRLGRVLWRLGRLEEANQALRAATLAGEGSLLYLAHLFLGQCLEDSGDVDSAIEQYHKAIALRPDTQTGAVALAHALFLKGDGDQARDVLEVAATFTGRRRTLDPFLIYVEGSSLGAETRLEALRSEVSK